MVMIDPGISRPLRTLLAVLVVALLGACGGTAASVPVASPSVQPPASQSPAASLLPEGVVAVTLSEMNLVVSDTSAPPGEVVFEIKNSGELPHEVVVIRTDTDAADLPMEGVQVIEDGLDIVARTDRIPAGDRATLATELEPGHYVLICNISGHYEQSQYGPGMKADFEVR